MSFEKTPNQIVTYTHAAFDPTEPKAADIHIEDIAHALSMMTRANGHFSTFYSVAQHCLNCSLEAEKRGLSDSVRLACLLHDASEAYLSDITRPVKRRLSDYRALEARMQSLIYEIFGLAGLSEADQGHVCQIDDALLHAEFVALHDIRISAESPILRSQPDLDERPHRDVENEFLTLFHGLSKIAE